MNCPPSSIIEDNVISEVTQGFNLIALNSKLVFGYLFGYLSQISNLIKTFQTTFDCSQCLRVIDNSPFRLISDLGKSRQRKRNSREEFNLSKVVKCQKLVAKSLLVKYGKYSQFPHYCVT